MNLCNVLVAAIVGVAAGAIMLRAGPEAAAEGAIAPSAQSDAQPRQDTDTATPIKHLVIVFNENVSFDHYFATYPHAANPPGEPAFTAAPGTPQVNNLVTAKLLTHNPNFTNKANGADAAEPFRLDRTQAATADQNHLYTAEQQAYHADKADLFPRFTGTATAGGVGAFGTKGQVMGYYDGNTVTAMWHYAQHFAMSDNAYGDTYGPSTPAMLNLVSGQTNGMQIVATGQNPSIVFPGPYYIGDGAGGLTMIGDVDPANDVCSVTNDRTMMAGKNVGDLLNAARVTWGAFMAGFNLETKNANDTTGCKRSSHSTVVGHDVRDYVPHHNWFQYFASTANPSHARPSSTQAIGYTFEADGKTPDPANHQYGLQDFYAAVKAGNVPAVSFIKLPAYQNGHAGYSNPLDEQIGTVTLINFLQQQPGWKDTAVIIVWDDSDGWYDHAFARPTSASFDMEADQLDGPGKCSTGSAGVGVMGRPVNGRCGPGTRQPFLVISPWAKANYVSHQRISLASVTRFIEDNWLHGAWIGGGSFDRSAGSLMDMFNLASQGGNKPLYLDPVTGNPLAGPPASP